MKYISNIVKTASRSARCRTARCISIRMAPTARRRTATTLFAIEVRLWGETRYAGMRMVGFHDLQARLDGLSARHVFNYNKTTRRDAAGRRGSVAVHPLVRTHDTGRNSYLSRLMTRNIVGMENDEGEDH